jgi:lambda family phage portal protein
MSTENAFHLGGQPYDGAITHGRRLGNWRPTHAGPQTTVAMSLPALRARSRDLVRNDPTAASAIRCLANSLVGFGYTPRGSHADLWNAWAPFAFACGSSFDAGCVSAVRGMFESGEVFIRSRTRRPDDGLPVPVQFELHESECVPMLDADTWDGLPAGNVIRSGIEFDQIGRRVAYWFYRSHPGDWPNNPNAYSGNLTRVPAGSVFHLYEPNRPGAVRGVPILAPVIAKLRDLGTFDDAVLLRQQLANLLVAFIKRPDLNPTDPIFGPQPTTPGGGSDVGMEPGTTVTLLPGEDVVLSDPPDAGATYHEYMRDQLQILAAGVGVPYELLIGDTRELSDRSMRLTLGNYYRRVEQITWTVVVPRFLAPLRAAWAAAAYLGGQIPNDKQRIEAGKVIWQPQAQPRMHPTQDVSATIAEVSAGLRSRSSAIAANGDDPATVDAEIAADQARAATLGILSGAQR